MLVFSFSNSQAELDQTPWQVGRALPPHSVIFRNTPFLHSLKKADFPAFFSKCKALRDSISHARLIFIDATWDPIRLSNKQIQNYLEELKPNGGSSVKDQVNRLEARVDQIYILLSNRD